MSPITAPMPQCGTDPPSAPQLCHGGRPASIPIWPIFSRVVTAHDLQAFTYLVTDGYFSKQKFVDGIGALDLHLIGKFRARCQSASPLQGATPRWPRTAQNL